MKEKIGKLLKEVAVNVLIATAIFVGVVVLLYFLGLVVDGEGHLLNRWLPLELAAGIIGSAYVLTVKNPNNYFGFVLGVVMSILLATQFFVESTPENNMKDQTLLYCAVFIPCQLLTLVKWISASKGTSKSSKHAIPSFMGVKGLFIGLFIFADIIIIDMLVLQPCFTLANLMSACVVASSTQANFLMIRKRTDAWFYWLMFSVTGIIQMICIQNYVTFTLYIVYLLINGTACIAWCKQTPRERRGWLLSENWKMKK